MPLTSESRATLTLLHCTVHRQGGPPGGDRAVRFAVESSGRCCSLLVTINTAACRRIPLGSDRKEKQPNGT